MTSGVSCARSRLVAVERSQRIPREVLLAAEGRTVSRDEPSQPTLDGNLPARTRFAYRLSGATKWYNGALQSLPDSKTSRKSPADRAFLRRVSDGTRTHDRLDHNQELYQLSYAHRGTDQSTSEGRRSADQMAGALQRMMAGGEMQLPQTVDGPTGRSGQVPALAGAPEGDQGQPGECHRDHTRSFGVSGRSCRAAPKVVNLGVSMRPRAPPFRRRMPSLTQSSPAPPSPYGPMPPPSPPVSC